MVIAIVEKNYVEKESGDWCKGWWVVAIVSRVVREGLMEEGLSGLIPEEIQEATHMTIWEKSASIRIGPEAGLWPAGLQEQQEVQSD